MDAQKFHMGDLVRVAKEASLFLAEEREAIVIGSYADQYGGASRNTYTLHIKGDCGSSSWYDEPYLTLIERDRTDLLRQWKANAVTGIKGVAMKRSLTAEIDGTKCVIDIFVGDKRTGQYGSHREIKYNVVSASGLDVDCFFRDNKRELNQIVAEECREDRL
jgi:hypothetical protein